MITTSNLSMRANVPTKCAKGSQANVGAAKRICGIGILPMVRAGLASHGLEAHATSKIKRKLLRILDAFLHFDEERDRFLAINGAMIVAESEVHHGTDLDLPVNRHWSRHNLVHAENSAPGR